MKIKKGFSIYRFIRYGLFLIIFFALGHFSRASDVACSPFRAYKSMELPPPFEFHAPPSLARNWEENLVLKISESDPGFDKIYRPWRLRHPKFLTDIKRYEWLQCLAYYTQMKSKNSLVSDWTAIVDQSPSKVLYPRDIDQILSFDQTQLVPLKLKIERKKAAQLQQEIFAKYHILALDHTDEHANFILEKLLFLLDNAFSQKFVSAVSSFRYFYAFQGHQAEVNIAAYHRQMKAISIGGLSNYSKKKYSAKDELEVIAALAHEIGHAFLFDQLQPSELLELADRFGDWKANSGLKESELSLYDPIFFEPSPHLQEVQQLFLNAFDPKVSNFKNLTSQYAAKNIHEWFADCFAANVLIKLGRAHKLGKDWQRKLVEFQNRQNGRYWVDYNNMSPEFLEWFAHKQNQVLGIEQVSMNLEK